MSNSIFKGSSKRADTVSADQNRTVQGEDLGHVKELVEKAYDYLHQISAKLNIQDKPGQTNVGFSEKVKSDMESIQDDCIDNKCDYLKFVENGKFNV